MATRAVVALLKREIGVEISDAIANTLSPDLREGWDSVKGCSLRNNRGEEVIAGPQSISSYQIAKIKNFASCIFSPFYSGLKTA